MITGTPTVKQGLRQTKRDVVTAITRGDGP